MNLHHQCMEHLPVTSAFLFESLIGTLTGDFLWLRMCGKLFGCAASNKKQATSIHSQSKSTESLDAGSDEVQRNKSGSKQHRVTVRKEFWYVSRLFEATTAWPRGWRTSSQSQSNRNLEPFYSIRHQTIRIRQLCSWWLWICNCIGWLVWARRRAEGGACQMPFTVVWNLYT